MRFLRFSALLLITALALPAAMGPTTAATAEPVQRTFSGLCPILTGHQWVLPYAPYTKGTKYDVHVIKYSCAQADSYIRVLVTHKVHGTFPALVDGGPKGWRCTASRSKTGLAYTGNCSKTLGFTGPSFQWTVG
jgi:hypothetical protein